jgi:glutamine synthetase
MISSYKRLNESFWAPDTVSWAIENRLVAIRIINASPTSSTFQNNQSGLHLEMRVPGADVNPYLAFSALLASGLNGIRHRLTLPPAGRPPPTPSTVVVDSPSSIITSFGLPMTDSVRLPRSLEKAVERMRHPNSIGYSLFPREFIDHFIRTRLHEYHQFESAITDWERARYLEIL